MNPREGVRNARKAIEASCLLLFKGKSCLTEVKNISASGILVAPLNNESISGLEAGSICILEIVVNETFNLHVSSSVIRIDEHEIAMHYTSIPEDKQVSLWQLLGDHVHEVEIYSD